MDAPARPPDPALKAPSPQLDPKEVEQLTERTAPRALVLHEAIRQEGEEELERSAWSLAWSGLAAGLSMGLSMLGMGLIQAGLPDAPWRPLVSSFGYTFGFLVVVLGRQQLFTENTVTAVLPLFHAPSRAKLKAVARLWSIVFLANIAGTLLFAAAAACTGMFEDEARAAFRSLGVLGAGHDFGTTVAKAVVAGWLIALMVWVLPGAGPARFWIIVTLTYAIALAGLTHIIAGSAEVAFAVMVGALDWSDYLVGFMLPTLIGNVVGGVSLVTLLNHAQVRREL